MSGGHRAGFVALLSPIFLMAGLWACSADDGPPKRYPSPKAVFDAYREAHARRDYQTTFFLLASEKQDDAVFEAYFACGVHPPQKSEAVLKRFGADETTLWGNMRREYKAKHGVDPANDDALYDTIVKEFKATRGVDSPEPREIWTGLLRRHIKDKAGFYEATCKLLLGNDPVTPIGDLEQVIVKDGTATGHAAVSRPVPHGKPLGSDGTIDKTFRFRKVDGGWLLDSL